MLLIINEKPIKEEHVSWYTEEVTYNTLLLKEVVFCTYPHPQAPKEAVIQQYETRCRKRINPLQEKYSAGHIIVLENALNVVNQIEKKESK